LADVEVDKETHYPDGSKVLGSEEFGALSNNFRRKTTQSGGVV
jgi:hypothetical protein